MFAVWGVNEGEQHEEGEQEEEEIVADRYANSKAIWSVIYYAGISGCLIFNYIERK